MNEADYVIKTPSWRKANQLCHTNMLKAYYKQQPVATVAIATQTAGEKPDTTSETDYPLEVADKGPRLQIQIF